jgi:antitoxin component YwqK of YwqJK toxin-antitoxin module
MWFYLPDQANHISVEFPKQQKSIRTRCDWVIDLWNENSKLMTQSILMRLQLYKNIKEYYEDDGGIKKLHTHSLA